jgi:hypothetical protein
MHHGVVVVEEERPALLNAASEKIGGALLVLPIDIASDFESQLLILVLTNAVSLVAFECISDRIACLRS